jgi:murein DD-endopeptidase MepM/ murein hydrolase activator NlpD
VEVVQFSGSVVDPEAPVYPCYAEPCRPRPVRPPIRCAAVPGYPLGVVGGFNGGPNVPGSTHDPRVPPNNWQSDNAIDLNIPVGTKVCAIFNGRISPTLGFGLSSEGYRLHLVGATDIAFYQHLSRIVVKRRQRIEKGQLLGFSGCGSEGVPHLHLALRHGDPMRYAHPRREAINYGGC